MGSWIEWLGGECPVAASTVVEVRLRCGEENSRSGACAYDWRHLPDDASQDIVAYRVIDGKGD